MKRSIKNLISFSKLKGFTLVELLVVVSMISIISGLGFASLADYSKNQVIKQSVEDLKQSINLTRFNAISSVKPTTSTNGQLCTSADQLTSYRINFCDFTTCANTHQNIDYEIVAYCGKSVVVLEKKLPSALTFDSFGVDNICKSVDFQARSGTTTGAPCEIVVKNNNNESTLVTIDENGNTSVQ